LNVKYLLAKSKLHRSVAKASPPYPAAFNVKVTPKTWTKPFFGVEVGEVVR
jgi:hypothetical protein